MSVSTRVSFFMGEEAAAGKTHLVALAARERRVGEWHAGSSLAAVVRFFSNSPTAKRHSLRHAGLLVASASQDLPRLIFKLCFHYLCGISAHHGRQQGGECPLGIWK